MARESFAFRVAGIEPRGDPDWWLAGPAVHREFWRAVVEFVIAAKDKELAAGKDRFGKKLVKIAPATRAKGRWRSYTGLGTKGNPPLTPANGLSRTRDLFTGRARADHAEFFWKFDEVTGKHWGKILGWHREGAGRLPERDVIGLSPVSRAAVRRKAATWWTKRKAGIEPAVQQPQPQPQPKPKPKPKPAAAARPKPVPVAAAHKPKPSPRPKPAPTPKPMGRIDIERATFWSEAQKEKVAKAIEAGTSTGFRQLPRYKAR